MKYILILLISFAFGQDTSEDIWTDDSTFSIYSKEFTLLGTIEPANSFAFYFESNEIVTVTDSMFAKMTEEEVENFFVLYIAVRSYNWLNNGHRANFFGRSIEINDGRYLEILCHKLLAQWIFDEQEVQ